MLDRRSFLARFGGLAAATAAVAALPEVMSVRGWLRADAVELDLVLDTFNGVAAMVWPGNDAYSLAQRESTQKPGAIAANTGRHLAEVLDGLIPAPDIVASNDDTLPISTLVAAGINAAAASINPLALGGGFASPFARLHFREKVSTWRRLEADVQPAVDVDPTNSLEVLRFAYGNLPGFALFFAFCEMDVIDPSSGSVRSRPVGWEHTGYLGDDLALADGWDEFQGYYQNQRKVQD